MRRLSDCDTFAVKKNWKEDSGDERGRCLQQGGPVSMLVRCVSGELVGDGHGARR